MASQRPGQRQHIIGLLATVNSLLLFCNHPRGCSSGSQPATGGICLFWRRQAISRQNSKGGRAIPDPDALPRQHSCAKPDRVLATTSRRRPYYDRISHVRQDRTTTTATATATTKSIPLSVFSICVRRHSAQALLSFPPPSYPYPTSSVSSQ